MATRGGVVVCIMSIAILAFGPVPVVHAQSTDALIRDLVRSLGYGAGIHHFKNYVLRGDDGYRTNAERFLAQAEKVVADLGVSDSLRADARQALDAIAGVVGQYRANLAVVQRMIAAGRSIAEIDSAVRVDDSPAAHGLATLRAGRTWTTLDDLEAALGYAGAIHDFKNYTLRGGDEYRARALARFKDAGGQIAALRAGPSAGAKVKQALDDIETMVSTYASNIEVVRKMRGEKKDVKEIDAAVKVDDGPATAALAMLRP